MQNIHLSEDGIHQLRHRLLIESLKSAFGLSRGGANRTPNPEAWQWIVSTDFEQPFSFFYCCIDSGVNPHLLLSHLLYYKRKFLS